MIFEKCLPCVLLTIINKRIIHGFLSTFLSYLSIIPLFFRDQSPVLLLHEFNNFRYFISRRNLLIFEIFLHFDGMLRICSYFLSDMIYLIYFLSFEYLYWKVTIAPSLQIEYESNHRFPSPRHLGGAAPVFLISKKLASIFCEILLLLHFM